jgi:hypothetical protein
MYTVWTGSTPEFSRTRTYNSALSAMQNLASCLQRTNICNVPPITRATPNPSFNLRANGMPQGLRYSAGVHCL